MTQTPINYSELVLEVAAEVRAGVPAAEAIRAVCADYDANPPVLTARFERAYPEGVPAAVDTAAKVEEVVQRQCARYRVERSSVVGPVYAGGRRVMAIGLINRSTVLAVDIECGAVRHMGIGLFSDATFKYAGITA